MVQKELSTDEMLLHKVFTQSDCKLLPLKLEWATLWKHKFFSLQIKFFIYD